MRILSPRERTRVLEIRLSGELTVLRDGKAATLPPSRKTRALLAYLILNPGPHRRERLCEMFWQIPDDPRHSLRWSLSKLRAIVDEEGAARIIADRDRAAFDPKGARIDFSEASALVASGVAASPITALSEAAAAIASPLLEGLDLPGQPEYETWRLAEQERARRLRLTLLRAIIDRLDDAPNEQADRLLEAVALDPYDDALHRRLLSALARAGRFKEAERQKILSEEALRGVAGADLKALGEAMKAKPSRMGAPPQPEAAPQLRQEIRFCRASDGVKIAWASVGEGKPIVKTANWLNHLEYDWESPVWRHVFRAMAARNRLIRYDSRGNGLSDWETPSFDFDLLVSDLEAVVEAANVDDFYLIGISQGCAAAVEYAIRHPGRVSKMVLIGGYARGWNRRGATKFAEEITALITLMRTGWGKDNPVFRQLFTSLFMPDAPSENHEWFNELQRLTTTPDNAARLLRALGDVDVGERLSLVRTPTLVAHATGDLRVPFPSGRELAAGIPGARFLQLDTRNHLLPEADPEWPRLLEEIRAFLTE
jgi:pimeloyl-ACP methyl ester carboxylesterase/DNA-binding SARP family transcriptional activator